MLLIDADLRRPTLHLWFKMSNASGLSEGLRATSDARLAVMPVSEYLSVLPAGPPDSDPMSLLTSDRLPRVIAEAREAFDWVIIDTPPIGLLPDANLLAAVVDAAVLVIHAGSTPLSLIQRAVDSLGRDRIVGVVLNRATEKDTGDGLLRLRVSSPVRPTHLMTMRFITRRTLVLVAFEAVLILGAVGLAVYVRLGAQSWDAVVSENMVAKALLIAAVTQVCLYYADLYDLRAVVRPARAVRPHGPGARRQLVRAGGGVFLVPAPRHRPRRVHDRGGCRSCARHRLAGGFRVVREPMSPRERLLLVGTGRRRSRWRASSSSAATSSASRSSGSSIPIRPGSARRCSIPASSARSRTSRRSCGRAAWIASS